MNFTLNAAKLRLATTCMPKHDIRYYLNGVLVTPRKEGGVYMVSTNGHFMMCVIDETGFIDQERIIQLTPQTIAKLPKVGGKGEKHTAHFSLIGECPAIVVSNEKGVVEHVQIGNGKEQKIEIEGKFPDWRRVLRLDLRVGKDAVGWMQQPYIAALTKNITGKTITSGAMKLHAENHETGIVVQFAEYPFVIAVVMPCHVNRGACDPEKIQLFTHLWTRPSALPEPEKPARNVEIDKALSTAFTALDHLANQGLIQRMA